MLEPARGERFLLQRTRAQGGAVDAGALAHQREQVQLALGARGNTDYGDSPSGGERSEILREIEGADELEDHVERPVLGKALGRDHLRPELRNLLAQQIGRASCRE